MSPSPSPFSRLAGAKSLDQIRVTTVVLRAPISQVKMYCAVYLRGAKIKQAGRFVAVQHPELCKRGEQAIYDLAVEHNLPLIEVRKGKPLD